MAFSGPSLAVTELAQLLPAFDVVLPAGASLQSGTANAKLTFTGPVDRLVTAGTLGLENTKVAGFDLGTKMKVIESLAGLPAGSGTEIQTLAASVHSAPEGTTVENLQFVVPTIGQLTGGGTVSAAHALDFKMRVALHGSGGLIAAVGTNKASANIPFFITGTSSDPVFRPDVKGIAEQKIQSLTGGGDLGKAATGILNLFGNKNKKPQGQQ
jgi:AsmA protein